MVFKNSDFGLVAKYILASAGVYVAVFALMYIFTDLFKINPKVSFFVVYGLAYVSGYLLDLKVVFLKDHSWGKVIKYLLHIGFFFTLGNLLFSFFINVQIYYIVATVLTIGLLFPLRFFAYKYFVYR